MNYKRTLQWMKTTAVEWSQCARKFAHKADATFNKWLQKGNVLGDNVIKWKNRLLHRWLWISACFRAWPYSGWNCVLVGWMRSVRWFILKTIPKLYFDHLQIFFSLISEATPIYIQMFTHIWTGSRRIWKCKRMKKLK